jgi:hypothetical protein
VLVGYAVWKLALPRAERTTNGCAVLSIVILIGVTLEQNRTWKDELTLYRDQVRTAPRSAKANYNLGVVLTKEHDARGAIAAFEESIRILPSYPPAHVWSFHPIARMFASPAICAPA